MPTTGSTTSASHIAQNPRIIFISPPYFQTFPAAFCAQSHRIRRSERPNCCEARHRPAAKWPSQPRCRQRRCAASVGPVRQLRKESTADEKHSVGRRRARRSADGCGQRTVVVRPVRLSDLSRLLYRRRRRAELAAEQQQLPDEHRLGRRRQDRLRLRRSAHRVGKHLSPEQRLAASSAIPTARLPSAAAPSTRSR